MAVLLLFLSEQIVVPRLVEVLNLKCALSGLDFNEIVNVRDKRVVQTSERTLKISPLTLKIYPC